MFTIHHSPSTIHYYLLLLGGMIALAFWFPLFPHAAGPLRDVHSFAPSPGAGVLYAAVLVALTGVLWRAAQGVRQHAVHPAWLLLGTLVLGMPLLLIYPVNANDLFRYWLQGKMTAVYGENPFTLPLEALSAEPLLHLAGEWAYTTTPYGPVWELLAAGIVRLTGGGLLPGLVGFKLAGLLFHLLAGWLIWLISADKPAPDRRFLLLLWLWNPALLLMFVADGHNDVVMLVWLLAGVWLVRQNRPIPGLVVMALAPLTKLIALLPWGLFAVEALRGCPDWRSRAVLAGQVAAGSLLLGWLAFWPFGGGWELAGRLLAESRESGGFSPLVLLILLLRAENSPDTISTLLTAAQGLFVAGSLWLIWRTWRGWPALRGSADILALYLLTAFSYRIWYSTWLYPWLLLDSHPRRIQAGSLFLLVSQLSIVVYSHLYATFWPGNPLASHLIGVPLVFLLPLLPLGLSQTGTNRREKGW